MSLDHGRRVSGHFSGLDGEKIRSRRAEPS